MAFYVFTITFLAPRLGVGTAIALIVAGQVVAALTIDHFGLLRSLTFPLTPARLVGAALMVVGVFLALGNGRALAGPERHRESPPEL